MVHFKYQSNLDLEIFSPAFPEAFLKAQMLKKHNHNDHNIVQLISSRSSVFIHKALLQNVSPFLANILCSSATSDECVILLPPSSPSSLRSLVKLLYTGCVSGLSKGNSQHLLELSKLLNLNISSEEVEYDDGDNASGDIPIEQENDSDKDQLKIKTKISNKNESVALSFPKSRSNRIISTDIQEEMTGFHGRVQKEYNSHPVGKYMGPYDQNKNLSLKIQLPESNLNFKSYTEFHHEGEKCYDLRLSYYENKPSFCSGSCDECHAT